MKKMLAQAQKMQAGLAKVQKELEEARVEGSAGGGMVKAVVNGRGEVLSVNLSPDVVDPDDTEILEDMILAAIRNATEQCKELGEKKMREMGLPTGGDLGGLM
ncbi:YbaB/EbfC family nucleoid-associated protein [Candidatus Fermentibacteria bacterium]|nr:YbaB/EbfC family nucleoid-associated protein [Candidatus Fermentibacteria bacterium]